MPQTTLPKKIGIGIAVFLAFLLTLGAGGLGGFILAKYPVVSSKVSPYISNAVPPYSDEAYDTVDFKNFWQAWNVINGNFYGDKSPQKRLNGAIGGMVAGLGDPYTVYLEPEQNKIFQQDLQGTFGGIGAELLVRNGLLTIVAALDGTPAAKANLQPNDVILEIDGKKTSEMTFNEAIDRIRGKEGTEVTLSIGRQGQEDPLTVKLQRATIIVDTVKTSSIGENGSVAYIKVNQFGADTADRMKESLEAATAAKKRGIVIDLRNNPGGFLDRAVQMIGMLIPERPESDTDALKKRVAVLERSKDGSERQDASDEKPINTETPLIVLVNGGSASASEIFAGAIKDYGRGTVIGTKTFGKGSVQNLFPLNNGGSIKVTIAKWFTPLGVGIDGKGIDPDIKVELPEGTEMNEQDPQVQKALELLK